MEHITPPEVRDRLFEVLKDSRSKERKMAFLIGYAFGGGVMAAERASGIDAGMHYIWQRNDPAYCEAFKLAQEVLGDILEQAAFDRAVRGIPRGVWYKGERVGEEAEPSDGLLRFLLKGAKPSKYMERADITSGGQSLRIIIGEQQVDKQPAVDRPPEAGGQPAYQAGDGDAAGSEDSEQADDS